MENDPLWYKDAVIYELHVRSFHDSNADGIGDFRGLTEKLDYLHDLGVTALWLLPFYPSPLKDDGYDIADYSAINPSYGTLKDFKAFLKAAHQRGLKVITELVINHTSDQHEWFQKARRAKPGSKWRDYYVWSDSPELYKETRIIFKDFEASNWAWDPVAKAYYWHRFYSHQPDLNFDNPRVQQSVLRIMDSWLSMGVDGLRLDAIPYLYEREGTICENLPETHAFLRKLRAHVDQNFQGRMLLAEANQWPEDSVAYFGDGDECHVSFHFPLMPRLFMAIRTENRFPVIDIMEQTPPIPQTCQWALFLRNHDELTLEMVTDEERDYMYKVYANDPQARINLGIRRRLAPLLGNNRRKIELMNGLLFALPGTPVIYYGDEIGMGDNIYLGDRNGVRTPMQWSADRNAGFSRANPQRLFLPVIIDPEYHHQGLNVEAQSNNVHSLLWWMKRLIALRRRYHAFGRGTLEFLHLENPRVLTFVRRFQEETILVVANLSRFAQYVELDLSTFEGWTPIEMFSRNPFPRIQEHPYLITLGPHSFHWFLLDSDWSEEPIQLISKERALPELSLSGNIEDFMDDKSRGALEEILPAYLRQRRWFGGKAKGLRAVSILDVLPVAGGSTWWLLLKADYTEGDPENYVLPVALGSDEQERRLGERFSQAAVCRLRFERESGSTMLLYDALFDKESNRQLLEFVQNRRRVRGEKGELAGVPTRAFSRVAGSDPHLLEPANSRAEQSNTSVMFGDRLVLKIFRRTEPGENPELEIGRFLTDQGFSHIPPVAGALEYRTGSQLFSVGILQGYVANEGDAWRYTLDHLGRYLERLVAGGNFLEDYRFPTFEPARLIGREIPDLAVEMLGTYLESARLLGVRTADMHLALASDPENPDFAPEPFNAMARRSYYQSVRTLTSQAMQLLRTRRDHLPEGARSQAGEILQIQDQVLQPFESVLELSLTAKRIRCHGDYHLGQVLYTGKDFIVIDFEGEPARPLSERRLKRSALRDVAGMIRSFHYAGYSALFHQQMTGLVPPEMNEVVQKGIGFWYLWVSVAFLQSYLNQAQGAVFVPAARREVEILLGTHLLEKAVYEMAYELNNRPDWVRIPLEGILQLVRRQE